MYRLKSRGKEVKAAILCPIIGNIYLNQIVKFIFLAQILYFLCNFFIPTSIKERFHANFYHQLNYLMDDLATL
jgi:hypothetical protein